MFDFDFAYKKHLRRGERFEDFLPKPYVSSTKGIPARTVGLAIQIAVLEACRDGKFIKPSTVKLIGDAVKERAPIQYPSPSTRLNRKLYHGTPASNGPTIEKSGLLTRNHLKGEDYGSHPEAVYLTPQHAISYAHLRGRERFSESEPLAIVEVDGSRLDPAKLAPDEDVLEKFDRVLMGDDVLENELWKRQIWPCRELWPIVLKLGGALAYFDSIPADALRVIYFPHDTFAQCGLDVLDGISEETFRRLSPVIGPIYEDLLEMIVSAGTEDLDFASAFPIPYPKLWLQAKERFDQGGLPDNLIHGAPHWEGVKKLGLELADRTGADRDVVRLFAMFHDVARENQGSDPLHGLRAADWINTLRPQLSSLSDEQFELLQLAIAFHSNGTVIDNPTIGTCWDADRLHLRRFGEKPHPELMSTAAGKEATAAPYAFGLSF